MSRILLTEICLMVYVLLHMCVRQIHGKDVCFLAELRISDAHLTKNKLFTGLSGKCIIFIPIATFLSILRAKCSKITRSDQLAQDRLSLSSWLLAADDDKDSFIFISRTIITKQTTSV